MTILNFEVKECKKVKNHFEHHNSHAARAIIMKLSTDTHHKSSKMTLAFAISHLECPTLILNLCFKVMGAFIPHLAVLLYQRGFILMLQIDSFVAGNVPNKSKHEPVIKLDRNQAWPDHLSQHCPVRCGGPDFHRADNIG